MADYTRTPIHSRFMHVEWTTTTADGTGDSVTLPGQADRSVQFTGSFNGASITMQGSNVISPGVNDWFTLTDLVGDPITLTAVGGRAISENTLHVRPVLTGGTAASVVVSLLNRSTP